MVNQKNIKQVKRLKQSLNKAKSIVFSDYLGLTVNQATQLRQKIREAGGDFQVAKNTLLQLSLKETGYQLAEASLTGSTAVLFCLKDEIAPIKTLYQFSQENELPKIKFGFLEKEYMSGDKVIDLAKLPSQEVLQTKLVMTLNSPVYGLVYTLKANLQNLVSVVKQIKKQKQKN